jgi:hydrogenase expression/formation protein HypE
MNHMPLPRRRTLGQVHVAKVTLAHGGGGRAMKELIDDVFVSAFDNSLLAPLEDQARFSLADLAQYGDRLAFTTDSFVVHPLFFPGGDIGKLAVCGTVNDLAVGGARPLYLSCAVIIEEGVEVDLLRSIAQSMAQTAHAAGVQIVTGDTKVVQRGACDKVFITTTGIGVIRAEYQMGADRIRAGDVVLVNGVLGDHGAAVLGARGDMVLDSPIESDCAPLNGLIDALLSAAPGTRAIRRRHCSERVRGRLSNRHRNRRDRNPAASGGARVLRDPGARSALSGQRGQDRGRCAARAGRRRTGST